MKRGTFFVILCTVLVLLNIYGCKVEVDRKIEGMSNDDIIKETNKCLEAGLDAIPLSRSGSGIIVGIQCRPRSTP